MRSLFHNIRSEWPILAGYLFVFGLLLWAALSLYGSSGWARQASTSTADAFTIQQADSAPSTKPAELTAPTRLIMPKADVGIDVSNTTVNLETGYWPLSDTVAHFANFTPALGAERGTLLIYGHNSLPVLYKSDAMKQGDKMYLVDSKDHTWTFELTEERIVTPDQVAFISEDVPFRVAVLTCNGWSDQYRRIMFFSLSALSKRN